MRVMIDNTDYRLYFRYRYETPYATDPDETPHAPNPGKRVDLRKATWTEVPEVKTPTKELWRTVEAVLAKVDGYTPDKEGGQGRAILTTIATGISRCSPLDNFDRSKGRNQAFDRLKKNLPADWTGEQKRALWMAFEQRGHLSPQDQVAMLDGAIKELGMARDKIQAGISLLREGN